jgi:hypothetical protein
VITMDATATRELLPIEPTERDLRRVAAIVSMRRGSVRPDAPWAPDDCANSIWIARNTMPFPDLAVLAVAVAADPQYVGPGSIHFVAAGVIKP